MNASIAFDARSSDGFGGTGPLVTTCRPGIDDAWTISAISAFPERKLESPVWLGRRKTLWTRGRRRSASTTTTRRPSWVSAIARFVATVDLPSRGSHEVTTTWRGARSGEARRNAVRRLLNASAKDERESAWHAMSAAYWLPDSAPSSPTAWRVA